MFSVRKGSAKTSEVFVSIDTNRDGKLQLDELWAAAKRASGKPGLARDRIEYLMHRWDEDGDGALDAAEFQKLVEYLECGHRVQDEIAHVWGLVTKQRERITESEAGGPTRAEEAGGPTRVEEAGGPTRIKEAEQRAAELQAELASARAALAASEEAVKAARAQLAELGGTDAPGPARTRGNLSAAVATWKEALPPAKAAAAGAAQELNTKFAAEGDTIQFIYGDVDVFFAGLEGLIGAPSADVMATMTHEHSSDKPFTAWNSEVERTTTPKAEWAYVTEGKAGLTGVAGDDRGMDGSGERAGWTLEDFARQPTIKKAGLLLSEVAGVRSYTCAATPPV